MAKMVDDPDWTLGCAYMRMPQGWATVHTRVRSQGGYFVLAVADRLVRVNRVHSGGHLRLRECLERRSTTGADLRKAPTRPRAGAQHTLLR